MSLYNFNTKDNPYSNLNSPTKTSPSRRSIDNPYKQPKIIPPSYKAQQRQLPKQFRNREYERNQAHRKSISEARQTNSNSNTGYGRRPNSNTENPHVRTPQVRFSLPNQDSRLNPFLSSSDQENHSRLQSCSPFKIVFPNEPIRNDAYINDATTPKEGNSNNINSNNHNNNHIFNTQTEKFRKDGDDVAAERILRAQPQLVDMQSKVMVSVPEEIWRFHQARKETLERLNGSPVPIHRSHEVSQSDSGHRGSTSLQYIISETIDHYRREEEEMESTLTESPANIPRLTPIKNYQLSPRKHDLYLSSESPLNKYKVSVPLEINLPPFLSPQNKNKKRSSLIYDGEGYSTFERELDNLTNISGEGDPHGPAAENSSYSGSLLEEDSIPLAANDISFDISRLNPAEVDEIFGIDEHANVNLKYQNRIIRNLGRRKRSEAVLPQREQQKEPYPQLSPASLDDTSANISNVSTSTKIAPPNASLVSETPERTYKPLVRDTPSRDLSAISQQYNEPSSGIHQIASSNPYRQNTPSSAEVSASQNSFNSFAPNGTPGLSPGANERLIDEIRNHLDIDLKSPTRTVASSALSNNVMMNSMTSTLDPQRGKEHDMVEESRWEKMREKPVVSQAPSRQAINFNDIWRQQEERHQQQQKEEEQLPQQVPMVSPGRLQFYSNESVQEDSVVINPSFTQSYPNAAIPPSTDNLFVETSTPPIQPHSQLPEIPERSPLRLKAVAGATDNHDENLNTHNDVTEESIQIISERGFDRDTPPPHPLRRPQSYIDHINNLPQEPEQEALRPLSSIQSFGEPISIDPPTQIHPYRQSIFIDDIYQENPLSKFDRITENITLRRKPSRDVGSTQSASTLSYTNSQFSTASLGTNVTEPAELLSCATKGPAYSNQPFVPSSINVEGRTYQPVRKEGNKQRKNGSVSSNRKTSKKKNKKKNKKLEEPQEYKVVRERQNGKYVNVILLDDTLDDADVSRQSNGSSIISSATITSRRSVKDIERHHQILSMCEEIASQAQEVFNGFTRVGGHGKINN